MCERVKGGERVRDEGRELGIEIQRKMTYTCVKGLKGVRG